MNPMTVGILLVAIGVTLPLLAWTFFRKAEYGFWTFAPVTKAHEYMRAPGGTLWWVGIAILMVGVFKCWSVP